MHILQSAIESYLAMNGEVEVTEQDLVDAGLLSEQSQLYDIGPGHTVVAGPGSGCAG
jgi:hypothetical protein